MNNKAQCACRNGDIDSYPNCKEICNELNCDDRDGYCGETEDNIFGCFCKNQLNNYPSCTENQCKCPNEANCIFAGKHFE